MVTLAYNIYDAFDKAIVSSHTKEFESKEEANEWVKKNKKRHPWLSIRNEKFKRQQK